MYSHTRAMSYLDYHRRYSHQSQSCQAWEQERETEQSSRRGTTQPGGSALLKAAVELSGLACCWLRIWFSQQDSVFKESGGDFISGCFRNSVGEAYWSRYTFSNLVQNAWYLLKLASSSHNGLFRFYPSPHHTHHTCTHTHKDQHLCLRGGGPAALALLQQRWITACCYLHTCT